MTHEASLLLALALALLLAGYQLHASLRRLRARRRTRRAERGELDAHALLRARGYRVLEPQPRRLLRLSVDGEPVEVEVRADYLVERRGRRLVAEVKTGRAAPSPRKPSTRRQLLEYRLAYDVAGVLLVDMEQRAIHRVDFPFLHPRRAHALPWVAVGALLGAIATILWLESRGLGPRF